MLLYHNKSECCGCGACLCACPTHCISMCEDEEGFAYPQIGPGCTECGVCLMVCPIKSGMSAASDYIPRYLGARAKDGSILARSTSGGLFTLLSDAVLERQGFIYGAAFDAELNLAHIEAAEPAARDRLRGAKYLQSSLGDSYPKAKARLDAGQYVLFTGTPCQVHGLRLYLGSEYERLLCVDLVCNGVPSPGVFRDYLRIIEKKGQVECFHFRDKRDGWHDSKVSYMRGGRRVFESFAQNLFTALYFRGQITRPVCAACPYSNLNRPGDITLGDFWGIEKTNPLFDDNRGVSLCLLNSAKGRAAFEAVADRCDFFECRGSEDCLQPRLASPPAPSPDREHFFSGYTRRGIRYLRRLDRLNKATGFARLVLQKCRHGMVRMKRVPPA